MSKMVHLLGNEGTRDLYKIIKLFRSHHLASGGDPRDFPKFLEENGITTKGFLTHISDSAIALETLLKD